MLHLTLFQLSLLMLHICLFGLDVCPHAHLYPYLCLHKILCFWLMCVFVCCSFISLCPTLYCNMLSFPSHCSASLPGQGVWSRTWQEVFVTRCTEGESKQWNAQTQEVLLSSCRLQLGVFHSALHDQKEETWATSLPTDVFLRVFRSPPSHLVEMFSLLSVISTLPLCSSTKCLNTGVSLCLLHRIYIRR